MSTELSTYDEVRLAHLRAQLADAVAVGDDYTADNLRAAIATIEGWR